MRRRVVVAAALALLWVGSPPAVPAGEVSTVDLAADPDRFHGQAVTLAGRVSRVQPQGPDVTPTGPVAVYTFLLSDARGSVVVVAQGQPVCAAGIIATVEGTFLGGARGGRSRIQASSVRC